MTIGLAMITNNADATIAILNKYGTYFDKWFITVADKDKTELSKLKAYDDKDNKLNLSYFKWCDSFGKARQYNQAQIDTDYWYWMDSDDEIENPERIKELVTMMAEHSLDAVYLEYKYMQNELGEEIAPHWRERLIRTAHPFRWADSRCHETLLAKSANTVRDYDMAVVHNKTVDDHNKSMLRNIELLKLDFEETKDPRTAMYLGDNLMYLKKYDEALQYHLYLLQNGGWDEDKYRAWLRVAEIFYQQGNYAEALNACNAAEDILPEFPDSYFLKASVYNAMNKPTQTYEWVKVGMMKPIPDTMSVHDPTIYEYRGIFMGALAALELGKIDEAINLYALVRKRSPQYKLAKDMQPIFEEAYEDQEAIKRLKWLLYYAKDKGGNVERLLAGVPPKIVADPRLNADRAKLLPKKVWGKGSIAYYCGPAAESWGPDTLAKGMGGSEEAVVYLSRELAKLGHQVTVYNDREEAYDDNGVAYKPWTLLNPHDKFDIFVAWRAPENVRNVDARLKIVDLHDTIEAERVYAAAEEKNVLFFVKSNYHRSLYPDLPDDRFVVVGNGILKEQFND